MEQKLDFSLPEKKNKGSIGSRIAVLLLLVVVILAGVNLFVSLRGDNSISDKGGYGLTVEQAKELALKLSARGLNDAAVDVWKDYLASAKIDDEQKARALFQIAVLLEKSDRNQEAIEYYWRSEMACKIDSLERDINSGIKNCFEKMGSFSALRYEMMDRTSISGDEVAGGEVVAEIGVQKITKANLDTIIESQVDNQLAQYSMFMDEGQLKEQKKRMLEQSQSPQAKIQILQGWIAQELLYREGLSEGLANEADVKAMFDEARRGILSQQLMNNELAMKINITETDLQTYYEVNKSNYVQPAVARVSHILVDSEDKAKDVIGRIQGGKDFGEIAKTESIDETTKESGGKIDADIMPGEYVAGIGQAVELNKQIFASTEGVVLSEPYKSEKGWEAVKVDSISPERQKSFDEVSSEVARELTQKKRQEVQQELIKRLMDKYGAVVHSSQFGQPGTEEEQ